MKTRKEYEDIATEVVNVLADKKTILCGSCSCFRNSVRSSSVQSNSTVNKKRRRLIDYGN